MLIACDCHVTSGDEILDIHGTTVTGLTVTQVAEVIKKVPDEFLATVQPITALKKGAQVDTARTNYSTIVPQQPPSPHGNKPPAFLIEQSDATPSFDELEDCGIYDDEDDGDTPPPLPPRTEDALIIVDPPPSRGTSTHH